LVMAGTMDIILVSETHGSLIMDGMDTESILIITGMVIKTGMVMLPIIAGEGILMIIDHPMIEEAVMPKA